MGDTQRVKQPSGPPKAFLIGSFEAEHYCGTKDAERAARFAGAGWEAIAVGASAHCPNDRCGHL